MNYFLATLLGVLEAFLSVFLGKLVPMRTKVKQQQSPMSL